MEQLEFAFQVLVIGFAVVMITLSILFIVLLIFNRLFYNSGKDSNTYLSAESTPGKIENTSREEEMITAAITAAVYQYMAVENLNSAGKGPVISYQPSYLNHGDKWLLSGRQANLQKRVELGNIRRNRKGENV